MYRMKIEVLPTPLSPTRMILYLGPVKTYFQLLIQQKINKKGIIIIPKRTKIVIVRNQILFEGKDFFNARKLFSNIFMYFNFAREESMVSIVRIYIISFYQRVIYYRMQSNQKQSKKQIKSAGNRINVEQLQRIRDIQGILKIDLIAIPEKIIHGSVLKTKQSHQTSRKSYKSLAINMVAIQPPLPRVKKQKNKDDPKVVVGEKKKLRILQKQPAKSNVVKTQKHEDESSLAKPQEFQYVEKKLKVGKKSKSNAMKEFILQTLNRAKAEGTCLVMHKGTAQSNYSPVNRNKSETTKNKKEQFPLVLVQVEGEVKKQTKSIFGSNARKIVKNASSKSTPINLPSINQKWVDMAKQYEKQHPRQHPVIMEEIQQKIEVEAEDPQKFQDIKQQIVNQSIVKE